MELMEETERQIQHKQRCIQANKILRENLNSGAIGFGKKEQGDGFDGNQSISASLVSSIHRNQDKS